MFLYRNNQASIHTLSAQMTQMFNRSQAPLISFPKLERKAIYVQCKYNDGVHFPDNCTSTLDLMNLPVVTNQLAKPKIRYLNLTVRV